VTQCRVSFSQKMFTKTPITCPTRAMKRKLPQLVRSAFVVYPKRARAPNIAAVTSSVAKIDFDVNAAKVLRDGKSY